MARTKMPQHRIDMDILRRSPGRAITRISPSEDVNICIITTSAVASSTLPPLSTAIRLTANRFSHSIARRRNSACAIPAIGCRSHAVQAPLAQYTFGLSTAGMLCAFTLKEDRKKRSSIATGDSAGDLASAIGTAAAAIPKRWEIEKCKVHLHMHARCGDIILMI